MSPLEFNNVTELTELLKKYGVSTRYFPLDWLCQTSFFKDPASSCYHLNVPGGLFRHSMNVTMALVDMTEKNVAMTWQRPESPIIVGMLHDVTKIGKYKASSDMNPLTNDLEIIYEYDKDYVNYGGHGEDSVIKILLNMALTEEELLCIRYHMGAYEKEDWDGFDRAIRKYPNVLFTHMADMMASKLMEN